jgi:hypothetical protein
VGFTCVAETGTFEIGGFNMGSSQKYKNVFTNGQVAFVVDDLTGPVASLRALAQRQRTS